jgi:hypothetical protein
MATHWVSRQAVRSQRRSGVSACCARDDGREGDDQPRRHAHRFNRVAVSLIRRSRPPDNARPVTLSHCKQTRPASARMRRRIIPPQGRRGRSAIKRREEGAPEAPFGAPHPRSRRRSSVCAMCVPLSAGLRHGGNARDKHRCGPQLHPTAVSETAATSSSRRRPATSPGRGSTTAITAS